MRHFGAQNGPFAPYKIYFGDFNLLFFSENLLMSPVSFIHAYLHAKNQSQILLY